MGFGGTIGSTSTTAARAWALAKSGGTLATGTDRRVERHHLLLLAPSRRTDTVRSSASRLPTTSSTGTLASECSRTL